MFDQIKDKIKKVGSAFFQEAKQEVKHCTKEQILKYIERQERREITVEQALKELRISNITWYKIKKERNN